MKHFSKLACFGVLGLALSSCDLKRKGSESSVEQDPVIISGTNIINLAPSCTVLTSTQRRQEVDCALVLKEPTGDRVLTSVPSGLAVQWQDPALVSGSRFEVVSQQVAAGGASFRAVIDLASTLTTKIEFAFVGSLVTTGESHRGSQIVTVPYSVRTYGVVAQLRNIFLPGLGGDLNRRLPAAVQQIARTTSSNLGGGERGFKPVQWPAHRLPFSINHAQANPVCSLRNRVYIAGQRNIFVIEDGFAKVFAGSTTAAGRLTLGVKPVTDPLEITLGSQPAIVCREGATETDDEILIGSTEDRFNNHATRYGDSYVILARINSEGKGTYSVLRPRLSGVSSMAVAKNGDVYFWNVSRNLEGTAGKLELLKVQKDGAYREYGDPTLPAGLSLGGLRAGGGGFSGAIAVAENGGVFVSVPALSSVFEAVFPQTEPAEGKIPVQLKLAVGNGRVRSGGFPIPAPALAQLSLIRPLGLAFVDAQRLLIADYGAGEVLLYDPSKASALPIYQFAPSAAVVDVASFSVSALKDGALVGIQPTAVDLRVRIEGAAVTQDLQNESTSAVVRLRFNPQANRPLASAVVITHPRHRWLEVGDNFYTSTSVEAFLSPGNSYRTLSGLTSLRSHNGGFCYSIKSLGKIQCVGRDSLVRDVFDTHAQTSGENYVPTDFAIAKDGTFYVTVQDRQVILKVTPGGEVSMIAGTRHSGAVFPEVDPTRLQQRPEILVGPGAIEVDESGSVYFADWVNRDDSALRLRASYLKKLELQPGGTYVPRIIAGGAVRPRVGSDTDGAAPGSEEAPFKFVLYPDWTNQRYQPFMPITDLRLLPNGDLALALRGVDGLEKFGNDFLTGSSGELVLHSNGTLKTIAGGPAAKAKQPNGPALEVMVSPYSLDTSANGSIYFWDHAAQIRRVWKCPTGGNYFVETIVEPDPATRCGGGVKQGTATESEIQSSWSATLNTVCVGEPLGIAVEDTCTATGGGEFKLRYSQNFNVGQNTPMLVEASRGCY